MHSKDETSGRTSIFTKRGGVESPLNVKKLRKTLDSKPYDYIEEDMDSQRDIFRN
jgi:hypothetical protein